MQSGLLGNEAELKPLKRLVTDENEGNPFATAVFLFEFGERLARGWYHSGSLRESLVMVKAEANLDQFLACSY